MPKIIYNLYTFLSYGFIDGSVSSSIPHTNKTVYPFKIRSEPWLLSNSTLKNVSDKSFEGENCLVLFVTRNQYQAREMCLTHPTISIVAKHDLSWVFWFENVQNQVVIICLFTGTGRYKAQLVSGFCLLWFNRPGIYNIDSITSNMIHYECTFRILTPIWNISNLKYFMRNYYYVYVSFLKI